MIKMNNTKLADLLLPSIQETPEYYINLYPKRNLKPNAMVTRYAPSPTGFQHLGGVFAALIPERLAHQSEGIFYFRIEDTDKKREVAGAIEDSTNTLRDFGIHFDEGVVDSTKNKISLRSSIKVMLHQPVWHHLLIIISESHFIHKTIGLPLFLSNSSGV
jgi:hypothetical protein